MKFIRILANNLFKYRGFIPIPFIALMLIFFNVNKLSIMIGLPILAIGEGLRIWGVSYAGEITRTTLRLRADFLVTTGPFSYIRNPLYVGNILIYLGFGIFSWALYPSLQIILVLWFIIQYRLIIIIEEDFLEEEFGEVYLEYKRKVPRFIPKLRSFNHNKIKSPEPNLLNALRSEGRTFQAFISVGIISLIIYLVK